MTDQLGSSGLSGSRDSDYIGRVRDRVDAALSCLGGRCGFGEVCANCDLKVDLALILGRAQREAQLEEVR